MVTLIKKKLKKMLPQYFLVRRLPKEARNCILLTFDDGPHPDVTPAVLERLIDYNARAVFFIPGRRIERAPDLLKRIKENDHLIGNHTYIHSNGRQPWFWNYYRDLKKCQIEIDRHTEEKPKLFRPPGGRISFSSLLAPKLLSLRTVTWSADVRDWQCRTIKEACQSAKDLLQLLTSRDIVLLHDDNPHIVKILDIILPEMKSRKFDLRNGIHFV